MIIFTILFALAFAINLLHAVAHGREQTGKPELIQHKLMGHLITIGWVAWVALLFTDPVRTGFSYYAVAGGALGLLGILLMAIAHKQVPFHDPGYLVTTGIYSKIRHPIYYASILIVVGFPLLTGSVYTLYSSVLWIIFQLYLRALDERELIKKYGKEYEDYKKKVRI